MTVAGWITLIVSWTFVTGVSAFLVVKTLRAPRSADQEAAPKNKQPQPR